MLLIENRHPIVQYSENMTDKEFVAFCMANKDMRIERDKHRNIIIMSPLTGRSGYYETEVFTEVKLWTRKHAKGLALGSSSGFKLPNGAMRAPDACWISPERWATVTEADKDDFLPVVPDFIIEVRSKTDSLKKLQEKMLDWIENGVRLGWLIDPKHQNSHIYRNDGTIEMIEGFDKVLSGGEIMPHFELDLGLLKMP